MNQYRELVQDTLKYLLERKMCLSSRKSHKRCYDEYGAFLQETEKEFSEESSALWLEELNASHSRQECYFWRQYIAQLHAFQKDGAIPDYLFYQIRSSYEKVELKLRNQLNLYLENRRKQYTSSSFEDAKVFCSRILLFFQKQGIEKIEDLEYKHLDAFYRHNPYANKETYYVYLSHARQMLGFFSLLGLCPEQYSMILNEGIYEHVGNLDSFQPETINRILEIMDEGSDLDSESFFKLKEAFLDSMKMLSYKQTTMKQSAHVLKALYLFLYRYDLCYTPELSWLWFEEIRKKLGTSWVSWRRILKAFETYAASGTMEQKATRYIYTSPLIENLPEWCRNPVREFGEYLKHSFREEATAKKYQYSCIRFCFFLTKSGLEHFREVSLEHIRLFCLADQHETFSGRSTCLTIVRQFLLFLERQNLVSNGLHKGVITKRASQTSVTDILTEEQVNRIYVYRSDASSASELRNAAIVVVGLEMGLRACDIINLKLSDIDWKNRKISFRQQKTKVFLELPMSNITGNTLYHYIKSGRPLTQSPYLFVHHKAPYGKISTKVCCNSLYAILPERKEIYHKGFHVLRRTFATNVLRNGAGIDAVMDSLGHTDNTTVMKYLSFDEERMRMCPLSMESCSISWKEDIFHV